MVNHLGISVFDYDRDKEGGRFAAIGQKTSYGIREEFLKPDS
jgi:hypothetical protein